MLNELWQPLLTGFLILLGLAGSFLPILPGPPIAWAGLLVYGIVTDFENISVLAVVVFGVAMLISLLVDMLAPVLGAKGSKASKMGVVGAFVGGIVGLFIAGPLGVVLGPLIGSFAGEYISHKDSDRALKVTWGSFVGFLAGTFLKILVVLAMAAYFLTVLF